MKNDSLRDVCARFIRNGAHVYDVLKRYDSLTAYVLGREESTAGSTVKWVIPLLKANGATDYLLREAYAETVKIMPGAPDALAYISRTLPTFITTSMFEHGWLHVGEQLDATLCNVFVSKTDLDTAQFGRPDSRAIREMCDEISALRIPKTEYELNVPREIDRADVKIIRTMDDILRNRMSGLPAMNLMESSEPVTSNSKAYHLLEIRKQTNIGFGGTMYVGSEDTDYQCLDLVRNEDGVALSFNGSEFAVRGSNVAVLSRDSTVVAVFNAMFYDRGIEAVMNLVENWNREYLKSCEFPDRALLDRMLAAHPRKLPEVYAVDKDNVDEVAARSNMYRMRLRRGRWCSGRDSNPCVGLERAE